MDTNKPTPSSYYLEMLTLNQVEPWVTTTAFSAYTSNIMIEGMPLLFDTQGYSYEVSQTTQLTLGGIIMIVCLTVPPGIAIIVFIVLFVMRFISYWTVIHKQTKVNEQYRQRLLEMQENFEEQDELARAQKQGWIIQFQDIEFKEKIAEGTFGVVFKGMVKGSVVAIKKLKVRFIHTS
jgi:hypothetical protein